MHISLFWAFCMIGQIAVAQSNQEEYLQSSPEKAQFNTKQWGKLKGKMKQESSGSNASDGGFSGGDFSTESSAEGSAYEYETEDYKGEYSEYQNYEDPENEDYEYDEDYDNYEHQDNYYQNDKEYGDGEYNGYEKSKSAPPISKPKKPRKRNSNVNTPGEGFFTLWKILGIVVIGGLIAFVIYYFFMRYGGSETGTAVHLDFDDVPPSEIPKTELERRLEEALAREDFREAIRIYFIFIIKDLSSKNWISWERKKTNMSYLIEMRSKPQFNLFNETVSIYDIVWYGNYTITKSIYNDVEPKFKQLLSAINAQ